MRQLIITALFLSPVAAGAQGINRAASVGVTVQRSSHFYTTFDGFPVNQTRYSRLVSGNPYLFDTFLPAMLVMPNGTGYEGVQVRLNLAENELQYRDAKGNELVTKVPIHKVLIRDTVNGTQKVMVSTWALPSGAPRTGWYEQLAEGAAALYRLDERRLITEKPFNSASEEQRIEQRIRLFVVKEGRYTEVKKAKDLMPLFADQQPAMDYFMRQQEGSWEEKAAAAIRYYNGLADKGGKPAL